MSGIALIVVKCTALAVIQGTRTLDAFSVYFSETFSYRYGSKTSFKKIPLSFEKLKSKAVFCHFTWISFFVFQ